MTARKPVITSAPGGRVHPSLRRMPLFVVKDESLERYVGLRCKFKDPKWPAEREAYTVQAVQRIYDGSLALRVVSDQDVHAFGRPARVAELLFEN